MPLKHPVPENALLYLLCNSLITVTLCMPVSGIHELL